jgi:hypothetical protein
MIIRQYIIIVVRKNVILVTKSRINKMGAAYGTYGGEDIYIYIWF